MLCIAGATLIRVLALAYLGKVSRDKEKACKIPHARGVKTGRGARYLLLGIVPVRNI